MNNQWGRNVWLNTLFYEGVFEGCLFIPYLIRHRLSYVLYVRYFLNSTITNMAMVRKFVFLSGMFNVY